MASPTPSGQQSDKDVHPQDLTNTPLPGGDPGDGETTPNVFIEDVGSLSELSVMESATMSALISAALGDTNDEDTLDLSKLVATTPGPTSGMMRPSPLPDDDAISMELPAIPGGEGSLSFVARSDVHKMTESVDDVISMEPAKPVDDASSSAHWFAPPKSGSRLVTGGAKPHEPSDIFTGNTAGASSLNTGASNDLAKLASSINETSNILYDRPADAGPSSDLFGDSRLITGNSSEASRVSSDILAGLGATSDILTSDSHYARGSSVFDDPGSVTNKHNPDTGGSVVSPDQFVPLFDEAEGSDVDLGRKAGLKPARTAHDTNDNDPGRVNFAIAKKPADGSGGGASTSSIGMRKDFIEEAAAELMDDSDQSDVNLANPHAGPDSQMGLDDEESGNLFDGPTVADIDMDGASGVNLLDPMAGKRRGSEHGSRRAHSDSIFPGPDSAIRPSKPTRPESKARVPTPIKGPDSEELSSGIFPPNMKQVRENSDHELVSFDMPKPEDHRDGNDRTQPSGMIDWSMSPADSGNMAQPSQITENLDLSGELREAVSDHGMVEPADSDSVFDITMPEDASTESQIMRVDAYAKAAAAGVAVAESGIIAGRSGKIPKVEPASSRTKFTPPPPVRRSGLSWLGGTAAGLVAGVGLSSAAYLAGIVPNKNDSGVDVAAQIQQVSSMAAANAEKLKQDAEDARQRAADLDLDLRKAKTTEADLRAKAITSDRTARAANEARLNAERKVTTTAQDLAKVTAMANEALNEAKTALDARDELAKKVTAAEALVREKSDAVNQANEKLAQAEKTATASRTLLATAAKQLQAAGLIDAKANEAAAIAALPEAVKKVALAGNTAEGSKLRELADKLVTAQNDAEAARKQATEAKAAAEASFATATKEKEAAVAKLTAEIKATKDATAAEVEKAIAAASKSYEVKLESRDREIKQIQDEKAKEIASYERKLAAQAEEFRQQISAARAGMILAATDTERVAAERSSRLFGVGADAYFDGRFAEAVTALTEATKINPSDARAWYYLGLAKWATGDRTGATEAFKTGGQWESRSAAASRTVNGSLERVQGPARNALDAYRP
jgi:hypothetical protein